MPSRLSAILLLIVASCGGADSKPRERQAPLVTAAAVSSTRLIDRIEAVGTASAREQVTLSAPVTERLVSVTWGVSIATLITVFLIPVLYAMLARRTESSHAGACKLEAAMGQPHPAE